MPSNVTSEDLQPGETCPRCGDEIKATSDRQVRDGTYEDSGACVFDTENVKAVGLRSFAGNAVVVVHK